MKEKADAKNWGWDSSRDGRKEGRKEGREGGVNEFSVPAARKVNIHARLPGTGSRGIMIILAARNE